MSRVIRNDGFAEDVTRGEQVPDSTAERSGVANPCSPVDPTGERAVDELAMVPPHGFRHALRAFHSRDFTMFWWGALASNTGSWVQNLVVPFVLYDMTGSAFWVGLGTFMQFGPAMFLGPYAGSLADRHDRRRVLLVTQSLQALGAVVLWICWVSGVRDPGVILLLVGVAGVFHGINVPSWQSFVNDLVPRSHLRSAITLNSLQFNAARAVGPGLAGILLATLGVGWAFFINAVSFMFVLTALVAIRTRSKPRSSPLTGNAFRQFARAIEYTRAQPGIGVGILVAVLAGALGNPIFQFTIVFASEIYQVGPVGLSMLNVSLGIGAILAAPIVSGWDHVLSRGTVVRWALRAYAISIMAFALSPTYEAGIAALVCVGASFLAVISSTNSAVQIIVADHMRGRVLGLRTVAFTASYPVGALLQGWLSDVFGPRPVVGGAGLLLGAGALALSVRPGFLGRLDDPHDDSVGPVGA